MQSTAFTPLRREDPALLTGGGRYTSDVEAPDALHAVFVRSPHPNGALVRVDTRAAESSNGVVAVLTARTLYPDGQTVTMPAPNALLPIAQVPSLPLLATDRVCYVGQPLAVVVAGTAQQAQQAAQQIEIEIDAQAPVLDFQPDSPTVRVAHSAGPADTATARSDGATEVDVALDVPRVLALSMEPRGVLARWHGWKPSPMTRASAPGSKAIALCAPVRRRRGAVLRVSPSAVSRLRGISLRCW